MLGNHDSVGYWDGCMVPLLSLALLCLRCLEAGPGDGPRWPAWVPAAVPWCTCITPSGPLWVAWASHSVELAQREHSGSTRGSCIHGKIHPGKLHMSGLPGGQS